MTARLTAARSAWRWTARAPCWWRTTSATWSGGWRPSPEAPVGRPATSRPTTELAVSCVLHAWHSAAELDGFGGDGTCGHESPISCGAPRELACQLRDLPGAHLHRDPRRQPRVVRMQFTGGIAPAIRGDPSGGFP